MAYTTIDDPTAHFQVGLYTSNTSAEVACTFDGNSAMQPDLVIKSDRDVAQSNPVVDSSRGVDKILLTNGNYVENYGSYGTYFKSFDSDGFTVNDESSFYNYSTSKMVSWAWKANGGTTTAVSESGSGNGGINACTYQANTTAGFSIIKYTGHRGAGIGDNNHTNVTHGLSSAPTFVIIKNLETASNWIVGGAAMAQYDGAFANRHMKLNDTAARDGGDYVFNVAPDSNYVYVGNNDEVNKDGEELIMYAWHDVQGYSKFGTYEGNGDANGSFSYTGFKPAFVMIKNTESVESWVIYNDKMPGYNQVGQKIAPNLADDQIPAGIGGPGYNDIDIYSNGFKIRTNNAATNESGSMHMYAAFAKEPLVTSGGVPATAV
jgi:hypothetical protein